MRVDPPLEAPSSRPRHWNRRWAGAVLALVVALGACSSSSSSTERGRDGTAAAIPDEGRARLRTPGAGATLSNLTGVDQLGTLFDQHQDVPQLILLLSPT